jgi:hypothetical protein
MLGMRMPRCATAAALATAVVAATLSALLPHAVGAATGQVLSPGTEEVIPLAGVAHPVATKPGAAPRVAAPDAPALRPGRRNAPTGAAQPHAADGAGGLRRVDVASVSAAAASGMGQLVTAAGISHDSQVPQVTPPDTQVAASSTIVAEAVNSSLLTMNRDGSNAQLSQLKDIWTAADARVGTGVFRISDPRIVFDTESSRWFMSTVFYDPALFNGTAAASGTNSWIGLAVSTGATPQNWYVYKVQSTAGWLLDQPNLGVNSDKVTAAANDFDFSQTGAPSVGAELVIANKAQMVAGTPLSVSRRHDNNAFSYAPAVSRSATTTAYAPFNNATANPQALSVVAITGVPGTSAVTYAQTNITMCARPTCTAAPGPISQPNTTVAVDSGDDRLNNAIWQNNKLWTTGGTAFGSQAAIALFQVDTGSMTLPVSASLVSGAGESFVFPAVALDSNGTPYMAFSRGSATRFMSSGALAYLPSTNAVPSAGILNGGAGQGAYNCGCGAPTRWGDYSGAAVDPADPSTIWVATEYSAVGNGHVNNWGTLLTRVTLAPPGVSAVSPTSGLTSGGTWVTITGDHFDQTSMTAWFGGVAAPATNWIDEHHVSALTPPHRPGAADVSVTSVTGGSNLLGGAFTFVVPPKHQGYWMDASDGGIFSFDSARFMGSMGGTRLNQPVVGMAARPQGDGYWMVASDGGIFTFGKAPFRGSTGDIRLNQPIVGMATSPSGNGYWMVARDGGVFNFGDAPFRGSMGDKVLNQPIVGMAATPTGQGYWLVASDGGIFSFGDARFWGSTGAIRLNQPIVGMTALSDGGGYWLVAKDGGIFSFGYADFHGSTGAMRLNQPIVGMAPAGDDAGYWLVASDGGIFSFGSADFHGSMGAVRLNQPIVGMAPGP